MRNTSIRKGKIKSWLWGEVNRSFQTVLYLCSSSSEYSCVWRNREGGGGWGGTQGIPEVKAWNLFTAFLFTWKSKYVRWCNQVFRPIPHLRGRGRGNRQGGTVKRTACFQQQNITGRWVGFTEVFWIKRRCILTHYAGLVRENWKHVQELD